MTRHDREDRSSSTAGNVPNPDLLTAEIAGDSWPEEEFDSRGARLRDGVREWWPYYLMLAPGLIYFALFHYLPVWEAKLAFEDLRIIGPNLWVGLKHFAQLFASPAFFEVLANTLIISAMKIAFVFPLPILLALLLNEVRSGRFRRGVQSVIYLPHFLSWVVIAGIFIAALSPGDGVINDLRDMVGLERRSFMTESGSIRWVLVWSEAWRSAGWDSLLYFAAIMSIDPALYEAAEMDGASRWQKMRYITLPGIVPTIATLFILNVGLFLNAGFDQVFNLSNDAIRDKIDIIDTYVYRLGITGGQFSLATAAGLFKGVVGMTLMLGAHFLSKRLTGRGVW
ncbi:ABC transporter permease [Limimaricola pyoseonensis]|uniref:Putative aldouronate transport system permease protein n=1 Tax=Limimaricola pyoseonensis TaxID=521013 RepID=A0A1G7IJ11_9RHOB|nr:ABC transporter permease subunit [Limimaricola pyoseonensis]SDF12692.1 putative aldouronate transport system permease protein [Limimaricola pyoseonensis]